MAEFTILEIVNQSNLVTFFGVKSRFQVKKVAKILNLKARFFINKAPSNGNNAVFRFQPDPSKKSKERLNFKTKTIKPNEKE